MNQAKLKLDQRRKSEHGMRAVASAAASKAQETPADEPRHATTVLPGTPRRGIKATVTVEGNVEANPFDELDSDGDGDNADAGGNPFADDDVAGEANGASAKAVDANPFDEAGADSNPFGGSGNDDDDHKTKKDKKVRL